MEELKEIGPLLAAIGEVINPYRLPEGYFDELPHTILDKIRIEAALQKASAQTYQVPAGYFDGLSATILSRVKDADAVNEVRAELRQIAPLLDTLSKENLYAVPGGYFEQADFVTATQSKKKEGKLISLRFVRRWTQYAAAAVMAGVLVTGAFLYTDNNKNVAYEKYSNIDISSELNKVSEEDLAKYLDKNEHYVTGSEVTASVTEDPTDENEPVQVLSDEEISLYLKENAETAASATNQ